MINFTDTELMALSEFMDTLEDIPGSDMLPNEELDEALWSVIDKIKTEHAARFNR